MTSYSNNNTIQVEFNSLKDKIISIGLALTEKKVYLNSEHLESDQQFDKCPSVQSIDRGG